MSILSSYLSPIFVPFCKQPMSYNNNIQNNTESNSLVCYYEDYRPYKSKEELYQYLLFIIKDVNQLYNLNLKISIKQLINTYTNFFNEAFDLYLFTHLFNKIALQLYKSNMILNLNLNLDDEINLQDKASQINDSKLRTSFENNYYHNKNKNLLQDFFNNLDNHKSTPLLMLLKLTYITDTAYTLMLNYKWQFNNHHIIYAHMHTQVQQAIYLLISKLVKRSILEWINYKYTKNLRRILLNMKYNFANKLYTTLDNLKLQEINEDDAENVITK